MAFFSMARKSNLVVTNLLQPIKCLKRQDVMIGKNVMLVRFLWSKTNQFAKRVHSVPLLAIKGSLPIMSSYSVTSSGEVLSRGQCVIKLWLSG